MSAANAGGPAAAVLGPGPGSSRPGWPATIVLAHREGLDLSAAGGLKLSSLASPQRFLRRFGSPLGARESAASLDSPCVVQAPAELAAADSFRLRRSSSRSWASRSTSALGIAQMAERPTEVVGRHATSARSSTGVNCRNSGPESVTGRACTLFSLTTCPLPFPKSQIRRACPPPGPWRHGRASASGRRTRRRRPLWAAAACRSLRLSTRRGSRS